jgi:hypothetical protein
MSALRDQAARRRLELNPLTTSLGVAHPPLPHQTPVSASSLSAPFGYNPQAYTPVSAVRQYNPQQWAASPSVASDHGGQRPRSQLHDLDSKFRVNDDCHQKSCLADGSTSYHSCPTSIFPASKSATSGRRASLRNLSRSPDFPSRFVPFIT